MAGIEPMDAYRSYSAAWHQLETAARDALLEVAWAPEGVLVDDENPNGLLGRRALGEYIAATNEEMPGLAVTDTTEPQMLDGRMRTRWEARQDGVPVYTGTDFVEFDAEGRISRLTMFIDSGPLP
jgi:hypothetical protein